MTNRLSDLAEIALAGYGQFVDGGRPPPEERLTNLNDDRFAFSLLQAKRFAIEEVEEVCS